MPKPFDPADDGIEKPVADLTAPFNRVATVERLQPEA